jgi:hypothetical protein
MSFTDKVHFLYLSNCINKQNICEQATDNQYEMTETQLHL